MAERENKRITKNGVAVYSYANPSLHSFQISLFVKAGCMYEDVSECGITHFLEHTLIRNVNHLFDKKLYRMLDEYGLEFNASTFSEMVQFYVSGAVKNFTRGASVITALAKPIALGRDEIDAERRRIKAEIRESDDSSSLASFTNKTVFEGTSLAGSIVGTNKGVDGIGAKRLEAYRRRVFSSGNVFFYVTGGFSDSDLDSLCTFIEAQDFEGGEERHNVAPVPTSFFKREEAVHIKSDDFTMVRFTFDLDSSRIPVPVSDLLYDMLLTGYNSKIFIEMSENRGYFYDTSGAVERYSNIGAFYFAYEIKPSELYDAIDLTVDILNAAKSPSREDADSQKAGYVDNAMMLYDDVRELNFTFAYDNHITGAGYRDVESRRAAYAAVDEAALGRAARELFRAENLTLTLKGNKKKIDIERIKKSIRRLI